MSFIEQETRWYPQTLHYAQYDREFPFFLRARQHKNFKKLATITGIDNADTLREAVKQGHERLLVNQWTDFIRSNISLGNAMNMDKLDTLK